MFLKQLYVRNKHEVIIVQQEANRTLGSRGQLSHLISYGLCEAGLEELIDRVNCVV